MKDTTQKMENIFKKHVMSHSAATRLKMGCSMFDTAKAMIIASFRDQEMPLSGSQYRENLFLRIYGNDFDEDTKQEILNHFRTIKSSTLTRITAGGIGIYEAVDRDCPKNDPRRNLKPDGSWLPKVGTKYEGAVSYWKEYGLERYKSSGLFSWHQSVVKEEISTEEIDQSKIDILYEDQFQVIGKIRLQLGDCYNGIVEVDGSIPFGSTIP